MSDNFEINLEKKTMMQCFEWYLPADSMHWKRLMEEAPKLKEAGITSVWLPPAYKGASGVNDVGYAVYDLYDLGEFMQKGTVPTKYGTKDEYLELVKKFKENGIEVLADIVLGHRMGADEKERIFAYGHDENDRNREIEGKKKITVWTKFTFPGRNGKYSDFKWDWTNFHGTDYDAKSKENGIYRFIGKEWDSDVDNEFGNYDYLMGVDLDMSDREVLDELDSWGKWYFDFTGVDGFRLDAVKHIEFGFYKHWLEKLRNSTGKEIFAVGEYWNAELSILMNYIEKTEGALSLFDVPFHFNMFHASHSNGCYDLRFIMENTLVSARPDLSVTFVDNHDTQPGQSLESYILPWFREHAYSLILLRNEGYPCVFYGDYYGIPNNGIEKMKNLEKLIAIRRNKAFGRFHDYFNHPKIVGWTYEGLDEQENSGLAVIMTIEKNGSKRMYVGMHFAGCTFVDALGNCDKEIKIDEMGFGTFCVNDGSVSVYVLSDNNMSKKRQEIYCDFDIVSKEYEGLYFSNYEFIEKLRQSVNESISDNSDYSNENNKVNNSGENNDCNIENNEFNTVNNNEADKRSNDGEDKDIENNIEADTDKCNDKNVEDYRSDCLREIKSMVKGVGFTDKVEASAFAPVDTGLPFDYLCQSTFTKMNYEEDNKIDVEGQEEESENKEIINQEKNIEENKNEEGSQNKIH